jgi:hypothetical protein
VKKSSKSGHTASVLLDRKDIVLFQLEAFCPIPCRSIYFIPAPPKYPVIYP